MRAATGPARLLAVLLVLFTAACGPRVEGLGPTATAPRIENNMIVAADGARLPLRQWSPAGPPVAVVLALHGFNDYSNAFQDPARHWAGFGIKTYAFDQRGFGLAPHRGIWAGTEAMVEDLRTAVLLIRERHPDLPLVLVGESMGAAVMMVALAGADPPRVDRAVLAAPAVWGRETMPLYQRAGLAVGSFAFPWLEVSGRKMGIRPSDNTEMLRGLGRDRLVIKRTRVDALHGLVDLMDAAVEASPRLDGPFLILYGKREQLIPAKSWRTMVARLPEDGAWRLALYENGWHMLMRDLDADIVNDDIAAFATDPDAPLPSGQEQPRGGGDLAETAETGTASQ